MRLLCAPSTGQTEIRSVPSDFPSCFQNIVNGEDVFIAATERLTTSSCSFSGFSRIIFSAWARAWEDSSAGMIPSCRQSNGFKGFQGFIVGNRHVISASSAVEIRMLRADGREIQPGRNGVRLFNICRLRFASSALSYRNRCPRDRVLTVRRARQFRYRDRLVRHQSGRRRFR